MSYQLKSTKIIKFKIKNRIKINVIVFIGFERSLYYQPFKPVCNIILYAFNSLTNRWNRTYSVGIYIKIKTAILYVMLTRYKRISGPNPKRFQIGCYVILWKFVLSALLHEVYKFSARFATVTEASKSKFANVIPLRIAVAITQFARGLRFFWREQNAHLLCTENVVKQYNIFFHRRRKNMRSD